MKRAIAVALLALWLIAIITPVTVLSWNDRVAHAIIMMALGLIVCWILIGGTLMYLLRDSVRQVVEKIKLGWKMKFFLFATLLALAEEAITTTMTNLAPLFGSTSAESYITASTNYFEVVLFHSVIVFIFMFATWTWLLDRYDFKPFTVFLLFGITGTLAETLSFGLQNVFTGGMWIFVYGLMVCLPAYCTPKRPNTKKPRAWHYPFAAILPLFLPFMPLVWLYRALTGLSGGILRRCRELLQ